ncbi:carbonic anhydrase [Methylocystis parvus]|uniref:Carbonic anhydrase n=1 Tax=Methylocystis parvus TaxID=134 RepID=A0A6B8M404_9HYPH|nr:carbonic anhydrase [Methylocystis parvus]QGM97085.1 carbonic anhydrase [Methylocystis parvus]WBJ99013.1 carbonic anhydrase [Methylocystis parvus OBBP]
MAADSNPNPGGGLPPHLVEGYEVFLGGRFRAEQERFRMLAIKGQKPTTMVISCCDSRVTPEAIFDAGPGELFVLRNVAALVPPYEPDDHFHGASAALEYAIMALEVQHVLVLGHGKCGGVKAFAQISVDPETPRLSHSDFIGDWIKMLAPAVERLGRTPDPEDENDLQKLEFETIKQTLIHLRSFPMVQILERRGYLHLHGAYFGVTDGRLLALDEESGEFRPVAENAHAAALLEARF